MSIHFTLPLYNVPSLKVLHKEMIYWAQLPNFIPYSVYKNNSTRKEVGIIAVRVLNHNQQKVFHPLLRLLYL